MNAGSNTRIYFSGELRPGADCRLPAAQSHHIARVLRLVAGDALTLFNGDGLEYDAAVEHVANDAVIARIRDRRAATGDPLLDIVLGQALSSGERMDYTVQKAVELGVTAIHPLAARRSVVRLSGERGARRVAHWQSIAIAACEQCGRNRIPVIAPVIALDEWLARRDARHPAALRVLLSPRSETGLRDLPGPGGPIELLAGPEGGLTEDEEARARRNGFVPMRLGPRVLRTETAALAALAAMQALWGDF